MSVTILNSLREMLEETYALVFKILQSFVCSIYVATSTDSKIIVCPILQSSSMLIDCLLLAAYLL